MQSTVSFPRKLMVVLTGIVMSLALLIPVAAGAQSAQRDCDGNAVLRCGAYTTNELNQKYDNQAGAKTIYSHFGISSAEVDELHDTAVSGFVTKGGRVIVNGKTVATNAVTAGRQNMSGNTAVTKNGTTFYTRSPSVSFKQDTLDAYVVMKGGKFQYAIIKSCGNPVKATPVAQQPKPAPVKPQAAPPVPISSAECRLITVSTSDHRQASASVQAAVTNAQIVGYIIDFGDGTTPVHSTSTANPSPAIPHQYARDGTYTITGSVQVRQANGQTETKTSETCKLPVTFKTPVVPAVAVTPVTPPPTPRALPDTGVGAVAGISAAIATASGMGYLLYGWLRSRFGLV